MEAPEPLDATRARELARELFGVDGEVVPLPSYLDANFRVDAGGQRFILRVAHPGEDPSALGFQHEVLRRLERAGIPAPRVVPTPAGPDIVRDGGRCVRLHTWLEGTPLAELGAVDPTVHHELGAFLGRLDRALLDGPVEPHRGHAWDLRAALRARALLGALDGARRSRVHGILDRFEEQLAPALDAQRRSAVHGDGNDHNVLVRRRSSGIELVGLTDFGDAVHTALICELAVALTYAVLERDDPRAHAAALLAGYAAELEPTHEELDLLPALVETRLAVSVLQSAHRRALDPSNEYVSVTEPHAWELLARFERGFDRELAQTVRTTTWGASR